MRNLAQKAKLAALLGGFSIASHPAFAAIDTTDIVAEIDAGKTAAIAVAVAMLVAWFAVKAIKMVRAGG